MNSTLQAILRTGLLALGAAALSACGTFPVASTEKHIRAEPPKPAGAIPAPVRDVPLPPPPQARAEPDRYSVLVNNESVQAVLFALMRDAKVNIDVHPGIEGTVTLNALDQTLEQILTRIAEQVDMRWEKRGNTISVMRDTPYLRNYKIDYVNLSRESQATVTVATQINQPTTSTTGTAGVGGVSFAGNNSISSIKAEAKNKFWDTLVQNVKDMLRETDKILPEGSSETTVESRAQAQSTVQQQTQQRAAAQQREGRSGARTTTTTPGEFQQEGVTVTRTSTFREAASVIANPETGVLSVRATSRQHEKVQEFLDLVQGAAKRQVLIEATVVEVNLSDAYQSGVDWSAIPLDGAGYRIVQSLLGGRLGEANPPSFTLQYSNPNAAAGGSISSTISLLNRFGTTRVLSSPRVMTLNNQTAILKVVDNIVYFNVQATTTANQTAIVTNFTSTQQSVPIGFLMTVTPQISETDTVVLTVRPTVSRVTSFVNDPNPDLARVRVTNPVPQIQTREFESVLRVQSGDIAILGGLMQDTFKNSREGLPIVSRIPILGDWTSFRDDQGNKTELVVFLRPIVVKEASVESDLARYRGLLPNGAFFKEAEPPVALPGLTRPPAAEERK